MPARNGRRPSHSARRTGHPGLGDLKSGTVFAGQGPFGYSRAMPRVYATRDGRWHLYIYEDGRAELTRDRRTLLRKVDLYVAMDRLVAEGAVLTIEDLKAC